MKKIVTVLAAVCLLCSCSTSYQYKERTARTRSLPAEISLSPTTADLVISETKATGTYEIENRREAKTKNYMEREAAASALEATKSDILISPSYTYVYKDGLLTSVTVTGYPAKYANFRHTTEQDAEIISKLNEPAAVIIKTEADKKSK